MGWSERCERKTAVTASVSALGSGVLLLSVIVLNSNNRGVAKRCIG